MQIHRPDPHFTSSTRAQSNFRLALKLTTCFVALLWVLHLLNWLLNLELHNLGVQPRQFNGLLGILFAPLLHSGFSHLLGNSVPLLVLGTGLLHLYPSSAFKVIPLVYLGAGILVWLFGRPSFHIGASGLVYGLAVYIFVAGIIRRDARAVAASMLVYFLYGTIVWGVLPIQAGVSWETHLAAAVLGLIAAIWFRHTDMLPRKRYEWEDEDDEDGFHND